MSHSSLQGDDKCKYVDFWLDSLPSIQISHAGYKWVFSNSIEKTSYFAWMAMGCLRTLFLLCETRRIIWPSAIFYILYIYSHWFCHQSTIPGKLYFMTDHCLLIKSHDSKHVKDDNMVLWISFWLPLLACLSLSSVLSTCLSWLSDRQMFGLWGEKVTPLGVLSPVIGCHTQLPKVGKSDFLASTNIEGVRPGIIWQGEGFNCRCKCVCLTS